MKSTKIPVRWVEGLHLRNAARIVRCAENFTSRISLRLRDEVADARSILAIATLCALMGSVIDVEVHGEDEDQALSAIEQVFDTESEP